jgi:hypothetical protein
MGRRVDAVVLSRACVFVLEYKVGAQHFYPSDIDQVVGYALDLKNFHEPSHNLSVFPILVATHAKAVVPRLELAADGVCEPMLSNGDDLACLLNDAVANFGAVPFNLSYAHTRSVPDDGRVR